MNRKAKSHKRKIANLRSAVFDGKPWAIVPSAMSELIEAVNSHDLEEVSASVNFGRDIESSTKILSGVAVIPVTGVLQDEVSFLVRYGYASSYQVLEREFKQAMANSQVKGVIFYIDSPGGSAIGAKRMAELIFSMRGKKPVVAYSQNTCGSAAYYLAMACDRAEGTADSMWGSVGTIYTHIEQHDFLEEIGIGATVITNKDSPKKGHGNPYEKLSDEAKATLQEFIDSFGVAFISDVAKFRGIDEAKVKADFGKGDIFRAESAAGRGMLDKVVTDFNQTLAAIAGQSGSGSTPVDSPEDDDPAVTGMATLSSEVFEMNVSQRVRAQLFALELIPAIDCEDAICTAALKAWFHGGQIPEGDAAIIAGLVQSQAGQVQPAASAEPAAPAAPNAGQAQQPSQTVASQGTPAPNVAAAATSELLEARQETRVTDLQAAAKLVNQAAGSELVSAQMVVDAAVSGKPLQEVIGAWNETLSKQEPPIPTGRVTVTEAADRFAVDAIDALLVKTCPGADVSQLSSGAMGLMNRPLFAIAAQCLELAGSKVDLYGDREAIAEEAMQMGSNPLARHKFYSQNESLVYVSAAGMIPANRPGDFPNILSGLANKFLDTIELDEDYSYPLVSATLPGGLKDFKPGLMINKGVVEELEEVNDAGQVEELGLAEEVLSYIFLQRFANKFGWTPVMIADDDLGAFTEGMIGLREAWEVKQNRLVIGRYTSTAALLDGSALFADRADTGAGNVAAANNNLVTGSGAPSDTTWGAMETAYADIGGIQTGKRVRGTLNVCFVPTGAYAQEARRTFFPLAQLEPKAANTTANVGLYRGDVQVIPESELRINSATNWYALRNPTNLRTATVVRGYFNGFGAGGRRERWYDPNNKTTWVSLEGRMAAAVKNWRYAVQNQT